MTKYEALEILKDRECQAFYAYTKNPTAFNKIQHDTARERLEKLHKEFDSLLDFEQLQDGKNYIAIDNNGSEYSASAKHFEGHGLVVFCCYPSEVELIGYKEA